MANKHYESQVTFTPSIKQGISGAQKIEINPNVSIFKEIDGRELLYGITVFGNTVLLKPETAQKIIISLNSLIKNKDLDQKLESKIKSKVIQMNPGWTIGAAKVMQIPRANSANLEDLPKTLNEN